MAEEKPFFAKKLRKVAPRGLPKGFRGHREVRLFADRVELDSIRIYLPYLEELRASGNVLKVKFVTGDGQSAEEYFLYDTLVFETAVRELAGAVQEASRVWPRGALGNKWPEVRKETSADGRTRITVPAGKVAFPPCCPVCLAGETKVSLRRVSAGWRQRQKGYWLVPVCDRHEVGISIRVEGWWPSASELVFSFERAEYAQLFAQANEAPRQLKDVFGRDLAGAFGGTSFILYNYVVSVLYDGFLFPSRVHVFRNGESRMARGLRGLPYSLATLVLGWWSIRGIVFTIRALTRNFQGGIDVTETAQAVLAGIALSADGL
jgi:hypothetical protein